MCGAFAARSKPSNLPSNGRLLASIRLADVLRKEAATAVREMKDLGLRTILLTGDRAEIAQAAAEQLGVDEVQAELLPEQKVARVRELRARSKTVAMLGDGVNDAPALMESNVGVAMGSGTDVARESAAIVLLGDDLLRFVDVLRIARRCRAIIMANFIGTLAVDGAGMALAAFGLLNPIFAALIHVSSELIFILNSAPADSAGCETALKITLRESSEDRACRPPTVDTRLQRPAGERVQPIRQDVQYRRGLSLRAPSSLWPPGSPAGMNVKVVCYAGRKADERPVRFSLDDHDYLVEEIVDQWYGPADTFFKVRANDGYLYILRHSARRDDWHLESVRNAG